MSSFKSMVNGLKENSKQLNEPYVFIIDTQKSIFLPAKEKGGIEKVAVVGIKLDKNLDPVKNQNGEDVKIAILVDGAPQKNGKTSEYYRNMTEKELKIKDVLIEGWKEDKNPPTRIGASVIMYHQAKKLDDNKNIVDADGVVYPTYEASKYCNRIGLDIEQAKTKIFHGIRTKLSIKTTEDGNEEYTLNAFDVDKQVQFDDAKNNLENISKQLGEFYDIMCSKYKDQQYNKASLCLNIFADINGEKKRIGREETDQKTGEVKYVTAPVYFILTEQDTNNKFTGVISKEKFIEDSMNWIKEFTGKIPATVSITMMPKYFLRCDNLAPKNGKIPSSLAATLSSGFYDLSIMTSPDRMYKSVQKYQYEEQPIPFATIDSKDNVVPKATHDEYLALINGPKENQDEDDSPFMERHPDTSHEPEHDPKAVPGFF